MCAVVRREGLGAEALTWVPGRPADIRRRGFDHAHLLAIGLAGALGLPVLELLHRTGTSMDQSGLGREERWRNVSRAFRATATNRRIAVVDDLVTSGATASAVAHYLRREGAPEVEIVAACRAV
jgi:predicted amidophosphoribosyltransferase